MTAPDAPGAPTPGPDAPRPHLLHAHLGTEGGLYGWTLDCPYEVEGADQAGRRCWTTDEDDEILSGECFVRTWLDNVGGEMVDLGIEDPQFPIAVDVSGDWDDPTLVAAAAPPVVPDAPADEAVASASLKSVEPGAASTAPALTNPSSEGVSVMDVTPSIAVLGIAAVASESLLAAMVLGGSVDSIRSEVQASPYWSEFVAEVKAGGVDRSFLVGAAGACAYEWARATPSNVEKGAGHDA